VTNTADEWKPVVGFEGLYEVSDLGRVRSLDRTVPSIIGIKQHRRGAIMAQSLDSDYLHLLLWKNGKGYNCWTHRLVAQAFIPNPDGKPEVNHKEQPKTDNRVSNLEWATKAQNDEHAAMTGLVLKGSKVGTAKLTEAQVVLMRKLWAQGWTQNALQGFFEVSQTTVQYAVTGKSWKHVPDYLPAVVHQRHSLNSNPVEASLVSSAPVPFQAIPPARCT
jgi:hypothetical protein